MSRYNSVLAPSTTSPYATFQEIRKRYRVSAVRIYRWIARGFPCVQETPAGRRLFPIKDCDRWVRETLGSGQWLSSDD